jgi:ATP-dependent Clp protease ATP-binding subunit ClpA
MFEKFTRTARQAVVVAQQGARELGHTWVGTEHLLLAVATAEDATGAALRDLGVTPDRIRGELIRMGPGRADPKDPFADLDRTALASIGIDIDVVRDKIEASLGPAAFRPRPIRRSGLARLLHRYPPVPGGHIPFTKKAKSALEQSVRQALLRGSAEIDVEHLALALVTLRTSTVDHILDRLGVTCAAVRDAIQDRYREAG